MTTRRDFLRLGALWVPALVAPRVAYSFLRAKPEPVAVSFPMDRGIGDYGTITFWEIKDGMNRIVYQGTRPQILRLERGEYHARVSINLSVPSQ